MSEAEGAFVHTLRLMALKSKPELSVAGLVFERLGPYPTPSVAEKGRVIDMAAGRYIVLHFFNSG